MTEANDRCPRCGAALVSSGVDEAHCPACLLVAGALWGVEEDEEDGFSGDAVSCGDYHLERLLGRGGSGVVYQARRAGSGPAVALKMLATAHAAGPEEWRRFRFEMESGAELEHPHLVRVLEVGEDEGTPYFVMDLADGGTLAEHLGEFTGRERVERAVGLLVKAARAVHFAHERGVLHRDLKPANILLSGSGEPRVADFGMARWLHAPSGMTLTGAAVGTPAYMAPEQAAGGGVTTAADQYSLGAILFHLLTGRPPFTGAGPMEILRQVVSDEVPDPGRLAPWLDRDLATICLTALRREPSRRYGSVAAFADDLERWRRGEPVMARPLPAGLRMIRWARRHPVAATTAATAAVAVMAVAAVYIAGSEMLKIERNRALRHEAEARASAREASRAREVSRLNAYAADVYLGFHSLAEGHLGQAREMLSRQVPEEGDSDLRGFEWHALDHLCQGDDVAAWGGHGAAVAAVAFDPAGKRLASGGRDGRIIIRRHPSGEVELALPLADAPRELAEIRALAAVAARSAEFAALTLSGEANPDDLRMRSRPGKLGEIHALEWSPDGSVLASGGGGSFVRLWSVADGTMTGVVPVLMAADLAFSADGSRFLVFAASKEIEHQFELSLYETGNLALLQRIKGLKSSRAISAAAGLVAVSPWGTREVRILDMATGGLVRSWDAGIELKRMAFGDAGKRLFGVDFHSLRTEVWRVSDGARIASCTPASGEFDLVAGMPGGPGMVSTGAGQAIAIQEGDSDRRMRFLRGHEDNILALEVSGDGEWLASGGNDHTVRIWRTRGLRRVAAEHVEFPEEAGWSGGDDGSGVLRARSAAGSWIGDSLRGGRIEFQPASGGDPRRIVGPPERYVRLIAAADGTLAAVSWPRFVRILRHGQSEWSAGMAFSPGTLGPLVFSPDSRLLASGGDDNLITVREVATFGVVATLRGHRGGIVDLVFSPDGGTLASSAADGTLRLWHVPTWRQLGTLHEGETLSRLQFAVGGTALMGISGEGAGRIFATSLK